MFCVVWGYSNWNWGTNNINRKPHRKVTKLKSKFSLILGSLNNPALLSIQNEANSLVAMRSKELWLVQGNHAIVKLESSVACRGMENLQRKQNGTVKSTNLIQNAGKVKSVFVIRAPLWAEKKLDVTLNIAAVEKAARKTCACGQHRHVGSHSIRLLYIMLAVFQAF